MANSYNGYSWQERMAKFKEMERRIGDGDLPAPSGPCRLCGDPGGADSNVKFEYHDEDYSRPYSWEEPAAYVLCRDCHIYRLHQRFARPTSWLAFLAHVRRGGYARDLRESKIKAEFTGFRVILERDDALPELRSLRPYSHIHGEEWFSRLSVDPASMTDSRSRPRP